jgi:hypothetical protein
MSNPEGLILTAALEELVESATVLSRDHGDEVARAVGEAREWPLDEQSARSLYTRILEILHLYRDRDLSEAARTRLATEVRREVDDIVASVTRPTSRGGGGVVFVTRNGLAPRAVVPVPTFNNKAISMREGYVDVEGLAPWRDNQRLALLVAEFIERNAREPNDEELVKLMQGTIHLPSLDKTDPFNLKPLADSIARKGVESPPIVTYDGVPKDGNRRIAASLLVLHGGKEYGSAEKERARYIRVWRAPEGTTDDQFDAIVVSRNFESDYKEEWTEYIKSRVVIEEFEMRRRQIPGRVGRAELKALREELAKDFAIKPGEVTRYEKMVYWADEFMAYHTEAGRNAAEVRYKTEKNFQWFYELDAGKGNEKLTRRLDSDDELKAVVYDLMFDVLDSGAQVRDLHRVVADAETAQMLLKAHEMAVRDPLGALDLVEDAITEAKRRNVKRRSIGFEDFLKTMVDRLGATPPDQWNNVDTELLLEVRRIMESTLGAIGGQATVRRAHGEQVDA